MARPRVFVSSTYYDLRHVRASLENFVESLGYEPILSEKGGIPYSPDTPLDESCYREVEHADIFVLVIGGRYGSEKSGSKGRVPKSFFDRYDSVTKAEYDEAVKKDIPIYIFIDKNVHAEYQTYLENKGKKVKYAHVDSVNVFALIEEIFNKPRNNPVQPFDRPSDIESWLRMQWAGRFRDMLRERSQRGQLSSLSAQVEVLTQVSATLQTYLEKIITAVVGNSTESQALIVSERKNMLERLRRVMTASAKDNHLVQLLLRRYGLDAERAFGLICDTDSYSRFCSAVTDAIPDEFKGEWSKLSSTLESEVIRDFTEMRQTMGLPRVFSQIVFEDSVGDGKTAAPAPAWAGSVPPKPDGR